MAATGIIARNDQGRMVAGKGKIVKVNDVEVVEVLAVKEALHFAKGQGFGKIDVETDSQVWLLQLMLEKKKLIEKLNQYW